MSQTLIARKLNISQAAVSRALRGDTKISEVTRNNVMQLARELNMNIPAGGAPDGVDSKNLLIAVWEADSENTFVRNISNVACRKTFAYAKPFLQYINCPQELDEIIRIAKSGEMEISGCVMLHPFPREQAQKLAQDFRCASLNHAYPGLDIATYTTEHSAMVEYLFAHLYELGHRKIGYMVPSVNGRQSFQRLSGYLYALMRFGIEYDPKLVCNALPDSLQQAYLTGEQMADEVERLHREAGVTAWIFTPDASAREVAQVLSGRGLRVPEDISLVGAPKVPYAREDMPQVSCITPRYDYLLDLCARYALGEDAGVVPETDFASMFEDHGSTAKPGL